MVTNISDSEKPQLESDAVNVNKNTSPEVLPPQVQISAGRLEIIHATNGRIRIRATNAIFNSNLETITANLRQYPEVRDVSFHQQTGSLIVTFDETLVSMPQILNRLQEFGVEKVTASSVDAFAAWKSLDFWQEQSVSLIPLLTGLAVTGGLGISGLPAIPVYMITADATRRVIDYLEPKFSGADVKKATEDSVSPEDDHSTNSRLVYTVVHAIPGRIRFHLPQLAQDRAYRRRLEELLKADPLVVKVRVNHDAASIAIAYQPAKVAVTHWVSLMELALLTEPSANSFPVSSQQNVSSLWADMKCPGMSFSLDYIAKFSL